MKKVLIGAGVLLLIYVLLWLYLSKKAFEADKAEGIEPGKPIPPEAQGFVNPYEKWMNILHMPT